MEGDDENDEHHAKRPYSTSVMEYGNCSKSPLEDNSEVTRSATVHPKREQTSWIESPWIDSDIRSVVNVQEMEYNTCSTFPFEDGVPVPTLHLDEDTNVGNSVNPFYSSVQFSSTQNDGNRSLVNEATTTDVHPQNDDYSMSQEADVFDLLIPIQDDHSYESQPYDVITANDTMDIPYGVSTTRRRTRIDKDDKMRLLEFCKAFQEKNPKAKIMDIAHTFYQQQQFHIVHRLSERSIRTCLYNNRTQRKRVYRKDREQ